MTNFSEFLSSDKPVPEEEGLEIGGSFMCQTCSLETDEARYNMNTQVLKWVCTEGHTSFIKDFSL